MLGFDRAVARVVSLLFRLVGRLLGGKHAADGGKFRRDLQE